MDDHQSSNPNSTLLGGYNFGFDENSPQLTGNHFKDPVLVSAIAVNGICVVSFAVLAIISCCMKGNRSSGRKFFAVLYGLLVAMFLAYARTMADEIVHEYGFDLIDAYLALPIIKQVLTNGTDTTLIYVVYSVIKSRLRLIRPEKIAYERIEKSHLGIFFLVLLFGMADAGLYSYAQVYTVSDDADEAKAVYVSNWYRNIHLSLPGNVCKFISHLHTTSTEHNPHFKLLIAMVTPFLAIRSVSNATMTILYVYLAHDEQKSTGVVAAVLLGLTSVVVYCGLVVIAFNKEKLNTREFTVPEPDLDSNGVDEITLQFDGVGKQFP